jgi:hypothetical protein
VRSSELDEWQIAESLIEPRNESRADYSYSEIMPISDYFRMGDHSTATGNEGNPPGV